MKRKVYCILKVYQVSYWVGPWNVTDPGGIVNPDKVLFTAMVIRFADVVLTISVTSASNGRWPPLCSVTSFPFTYYKI